MTLNEYQLAALETATYPRRYHIIYPALGLAGEAGEVAEKIKKVIRDHNEEFSDEKKFEVIKELGDVMWYVATLAHELGYNLDQVAQINYDKLTSRKERGMISGNGDNR